MEIQYKDIPMSNTAIFLVTSGYHTAPSIRGSTLIDVDIKLCNTIALTLSRLKIYQSTCAINKIMHDSLKMEACRAADIVLRTIKRNPK